jgi:hypothetical protein
MLPTGQDMLIMILPEHIRRQPERFATYNRAPVR